MTKVCSKCKRELPATPEYFYRGKTYKDGLKGQCKKCVEEYKKKHYNKDKIKLARIEYNKQYYKENSDKIKEDAKSYYEDNKGTISTKLKTYREKNKIRIAEYKEVYYKENKEDIKQYKKTWYEKNKEHILKKSAQYKKENKEKVNHWNNKRRLRKNNLPSTLTLKQWKQIKKEFNNKCAYCGENKKLEQDHFIALSKGGEYTHNNIIPACKSCNCSKQDKSFFEWYSEQGFYSKKREVKILKHLNYTDGKVQQLAL